MPITPIAGPVGAGKSQEVDRLRKPGDVLIDFTRIYVALSGAVRGPDGRFPEREDGDPLLPLASAVQSFALSEAVARELDGFVTTASADKVPTLERVTGETAKVIDPGDDAVIVRHYGERPNITAECSKALGRWYGPRSARGSGGGKDATGKAVDDSAEYWVSASGTRYRINK